MNVKNINTAAYRAFPLVDTGQGFYEIRHAGTGKLIFGLHCIDPDDPFAEGLCGTYIREELGAAESLLPDGFRTEVFDSPEAAYAYCLAALASFTAALSLAA